MAARLAAALAVLWCCGALAPAVPAASALGMNWGTQATHPLPPKAVVQVLQDNGIRKVKLFDADPAAMSALAGTGIEAMVAIPNNMLADLAHDAGKAKDWVKRSVKRYDFDGGVTIKYVAVGNEPFLESYNGSFINVTFPALSSIQNALNDAGIGDRIKATVPLNADVYNSPASNPVPSAGRFRADIAALMADIVTFLAKNSAPFTVNIYPFLSLYLNDHFPLDYAFFDGGGTPVNDHGVLYTNVFDANFDTLVAALTAAGHGDLPIIVGEVGWPTNGDRRATPANAQRFYAGLLRRLAAGDGTPARPRRPPAEVYLFGLLDEDAKSVAPGGFERHWGVLRYDGQPKFAMDLAGQGRNVTLAPARGVRYLSRTWCAVNPSRVKDLAGGGGKVGGNIDYACTFADCTPLGYGSSCGGMDVAGNASYAFNAYYQAQNQKDEACDFQGLALPTETDPSTAACNFTIQIQTGGAAAAVAVGRSAGVAALVVVMVWMQVMVVMW